MDNVPYIAFDITKYDDPDDMWWDVQDVVKILIKQEYQVAFRYDDMGIYILEYNYDSPDYGTPMVHWITPDDWYDYCGYKESEKELKVDDVYD